MSISIGLPEQLLLRPKITIFGVGGAGGNAVNNMIQADLKGVEFFVANTDAQSLGISLAEHKIRLGVNRTKGLGAGSLPEVGKAAAEESIEEIKEAIADSNMLFIAAGMGGGTGTGAAPVIARVARENDILTVGVVTKPFLFEGSHRMRIAELGIEELQRNVDTLVVIPNQNLFKIANEKTTFVDAFKLADSFLHRGVRGVTDLMVEPGLINLDFADIRVIMSEMGKAMIGTGEAEGENRAIIAAEAAICHPLLDNISIRGARGILVNITGGNDLTLLEVDAAAERIREEAQGNFDDPDYNSDTNIIFGSTFNENMNGKIIVSVLATGIDVVPQKPKKTERIESVNNKGYAQGYSKKSTILLDDSVSDYSLSQANREINSVSLSDKYSASEQEQQRGDRGTTYSSGDSYSNEETEVSSSSGGGWRSEIDIPAFLRRKK